MFMKTVVLIILVLNVEPIKSVNPRGVTNDADNEIYNDILVNPIIQHFKDFVNKKRDTDYSYIPNDVLLVQFIKTMQHVMFQLGAFYALHKTNEGLPITLYEKGFAIQFESILCNNVYSSKFPRIKPNVVPWKYFTDSAYFRLSCDLPQKEKITINSRQKRAIDRTLLCGSTTKFTDNFGTIIFPMNDTTEYYNSMRCQWTIEVAPSFGVEVYSDYILLEYDPRCAYDSLTFYEGEDDKGTVIGRTCGNVTNFNVKSRRNIITIKFSADETITRNGFVLKWRLTDQVTDHPGFVMTSTIVIDQHGDLNVETFDFSTLEVGETKEYEVNRDFKLIIPNPETCPLESNDPDCVFQTQPFIISKVIATGVSPDYLLSTHAIEVVFEHAIQADLYPDLYNSPKYCVTWDSSVKNTRYGSWSRRNGKTLYTSISRTTCVFSSTGVHAVIAMAPPPMEPVPFRFTRSWYCGHLFAVIWITITFIKLASGISNIPVWLNFNQLLAILIFCAICLCGVHMELYRNVCAFLTLALYYFGLTIFVWHLLKAAQFTGAIDKFFRQDRNLYAFYLLLGWGTPFFVVGIAGGVKLVFKKDSPSCWMAVKGGPIWGYGAPAYFIIMAILYLYYKGLKKTKDRMEIYNYPKLTKRAMRDMIQLILLLLTWATGILSFHQEHLFLNQYLFCVCLSLTVVMLCLFAHQARRSFERKYDYEDLDIKNDYFDKREEDEGNTVNVIYRVWLAKMYMEKWRTPKKPEPLELVLKIPQFIGAMVIHTCGKSYIEMDDQKEGINPNHFKDGPMDYQNEAESDADEMALKVRLDEGTTDGSDDENESDVDSNYSDDNNDDDNNDDDKDYDDDKDDDEIMNDDEVIEGDPDDTTHEETNETEGDPPDNTNEDAQDVEDDPPDNTNEDAQDDNAGEEKGTENEDDNSDDGENNN